MISIVTCSSGFTLHVLYMYVSNALLHSIHVIEKYYCFMEKKLNCFTQALASILIISHCNCKKCRSIIKVLTFLINPTYSTDGLMRIKTRCKKHSDAEDLKNFQGESMLWYCCDGFVILLWCHQSWCACNV